MLYQPTIDKLHELRLFGMAKALQEQAEMSQCDGLSFEDRLALLVDREATFRYKDRKHRQWRTCTLTGHEFIRRFLQHVLPKGFHKIRYYGLWHPAQRPQRENARRTLLLKQAQPALEVRNPNSPSVRTASHDAPSVTCPYCGSHHAKHLGPLPPRPAPHAARASPAGPS